MSLPAYLTDLNLSSMPINYPWDNEIFNGFWALPTCARPIRCGRQVSPASPKAGDLTKVFLMLTQPPWIEFDEQARHDIRYVWDDSRALRDLRGDAASVLGAAMMISLRARLGLCAGLYEWIIWRSEGVHRRQELRRLPQPHGAPPSTPAILG
jgi:hypothetical protein